MACHKLNFLCQGSALYNSRPVIWNTFFEIPSHLAEFSDKINLTEVWSSQVIHNWSGQDNTPELSMTSYLDSKQKTELPYMHLFFERIITCEKRKYDCQFICLSWSLLSCVNRCTNRCPAITAGDLNSISLSFLVRRGTVTYFTCKCSRLDCFILNLYGQMLHCRLLYMQLWEIWMLHP